MTLIILLPSLRRYLKYNTHTCWSTQINTQNNLKKVGISFGSLNFFSYIYYVIKTMRDMKNVYVVIPFTTNYGLPLFSQLKCFSSHEKAVQYADEFKYVEMTTTKLNG